MRPRAKKEDRGTIFLSYRAVSRNQKYFILDEFCAVLVNHRKHASPPGTWFP